MPRSTSHASNGPATRAHRVLVEGQLLRRARGRRRRARHRPRRSDRRGTSWSSAPRRRRRARAAAAGTARRRCCRRPAAPAPPCAISASAAMSAMPSSGLVGVSHQSTRVFGPQRPAHRVEVGQRHRGVIQAPVAQHPGDQPERAAVRVVRDERRGRLVGRWPAAGCPPRPSRSRTPARQCPLPAPRAPARGQCGSGSRCGCTHSPERSPPTPSCLYVDVWKIGTATAPVRGSGSCPAWIASVSNPNLELGELFSLIHRPYDADRPTRTRGLPAALRP